MKNNSLLTKIRGYQKADRSRFLLLKEGKLTHEEFVVYEFGVAITDWDHEHKDTYGTFQATNREISQILGWKSDSTICRIKERLIEKNIFIQVGDRLKVFDFEKWQLRTSPVAKTQSKTANLQPQTANIELPVANLQPVQVQTPDYSLSSFKGELSVIRSEDEYSRIWNEMGCPPDFDISDMKWIDLNVREAKNISS